MIRRRTRSGGFTLLELLVVLTLLGLILVVMPPLISSGGGIGLEVAARDLASALQRAQSRAITQNREVALVLDLNAHRYRIEPSGEVQALPAELDLGLRTARSELVDRATGAIRFFPDGSSTGGEITLGSKAGDVHVAVDWLTGRISIRE